MSHNYQNKERNSSDSSDPSSELSSSANNNRGNYYQSRAFIVCPPYDQKEKYDSSDSDHSCSDFSDLCEDKPRIKNRKKKEQEQSESADDRKKKSLDQSESEYDGGCNNCGLRGCNRCNDFSRSSIINSLGEESGKGCPDFDHIGDDKSRKCPVYGKEVSKVTKLPSKIKNDENSTKDASSQSSLPSRKFIPKRKDFRKNIVKEKLESSASSTKSDRSQDTTSGSRGKKFVVSFGPKEGHQWADYNKGKESIYINGKNGPVLHLYRGSTYYFCVEQANVNDESSSDPIHFFYLTNSPIGGVGSNPIPGGFSPVPKGCVCFKVDKSTPRYFYYQSSKQTFEGGLVIVHDK